MSCCVPVSRACTTSCWRTSPESWEENDEPVHRLERLIEGMLERIDDDPAFFRLALMTQGMVIQGGEAVGTELATIGLNIARLIRDLYIDGVASGIFRDIDPDEAVNLVGQQIYGAMAVRAGEVISQPAAAAADKICGFVLRGLGA